MWNAANVWSWVVRLWRRQRVLPVLINSCAEAVISVSRSARLKQSMLRGLMMSDINTISVVIVGVGGQGILLASEVVARAAMYAGFDVKTNEVHGMAQRGGSVIAQIRYGKEVNSPLVALGSARVLGSFEEVEALRWAHYLAPDGLAVVSTSQVIPVTVSSGAATYPSDGDARLKKVLP